MLILAVIAVAVLLAEGSEHHAELHRIVHKVGRCRALCIDAFSPQLHSVSDSGCRDHPDCFMCWENCEMFSLNFDVWGNMCAVKEVCFEGCLLACRFYSNHFPVRAIPVANMADMITFDKDIRNGLLTISWLAPDISKRFKIVFALFMVKQRLSADNSTISHQLELLATTVNLRFETRDAALIVGGSSPRFLLVAITRDGLVGQAVFPRIDSDSFSFGDLLPTTTLLSSRPRGVTSQSGWSPEFNDVRLFVVSVCVCAIICGALLTVFGLFLRHLVRKQRMQRRIGRSYAFKKRFGVQSLKGPKTVSSTNLLSTLQSAAAVHNEYLTQPLKSHRPQVALLKLSEVKSDVEGAIVSIVSSPSGRDVVTIDYDQLKVKLSEQKSVDV